MKICFHLLSHSIWRQLTGLSQYETYQRSLLSALFAICVVGSVCSGPLGVLICLVAFHTGFHVLISLMMHLALTRALCCLPSLFISSAFVISKWQDVASIAGWLSEYEKAWLVYNEVTKIMRTVRISLEHLWNWNFWDQIMKKHLALQDAFKNQKQSI
jgi:hypothetical protein